MDFKCILLRTHELLFNGVQCVQGQLFIKDNVFLNILLFRLYSSSRSYLFMAFIYINLCRNIHSDTSLLQEGGGGIPNDHP